MAMALASTAKNLPLTAREKYKPWYMAMEMAITEWFEYVTVTGRSWAGPIEHATFEVNLGGFEEYLAHREIIEASPPSPADVENAKARGVFNWILKDRMIHRQISPDGWKEKDGIIRWEFKNYRPKDAISVRYVLTILPKKADDVSSFVATVFDDKPSAENVRDLREIFLATWGIAPEHEAIRQFAANQVWYKPKGGLTVDKLEAEQRAVLSAIDRCSPTAAKQRKEDNTERREPKRVGS